MAASDMKGGKVILAVRVAREREGSIQYPVQRELCWKEMWIKKQGIACSVVRMLLRVL